MSLEDRTRVEEALRRIDELVEGLGHIADPAARDKARELVETVLDVHGLALARIMAAIAAAEGGRAIAAAEGGRALVERLAADEQVKALLLLYGLHPDDPQTRIRQALAAMQPRLSAAGAVVEAARVNGGTASLRIIGGDGAGALRREIETAIVDAAPDLDEIAIEWLDNNVAEPVAAAG